MSHSRPGLFGKYFEFYPEYGHKHLTAVSATILHDTDLWCRSWAKQYADNGGFDRNSLARRFRRAHAVFNFLAESKIAALSGDEDGKRDDQVHV